MVALFPKPNFFVLDDVDSEDVILEEDDTFDVDVVICDALLWPIMFCISAIEFWNSLRFCLTAAAFSDAV